MITISKFFESANEQGSCIMTCITSNHHLEYKNEFDTIMQMMLIFILYTFLILCNKLGRERFESWSQENQVMSLSDSWCAFAQG